MKKFLVFVMICVVALGIGFTTFRFTIKHQVIKIDTTPVECNKGKEFTIDIEIRNKKNGTVVTATSNDTSIVDVSKTAGDEYKFEAKSGGKTTITVSSNVAGFKSQTIDVTVGDGSSPALPLCIDSVSEYNRIGNDEIYTLDKCYKLIADLNFDSNDQTEPQLYQVKGNFSGQFDFNNHKMSGIEVNADDLTSVGLFSSIATEGIVKNLVLADFTSRGNAKNDVVKIGAIAGENNGTIRDVTISKVTIEDASANGYFGGVAGQNNGVVKRVDAKLVKINTESETSVVGANTVVGGVVGLNKNAAASIYAVAVKPIVAGGAFVGGVAGENDSATIENCAVGDFSSTFKLSTNNENAYVGGLVGHNVCVTARASIADSYALLGVGQTGKRAAIVAKNDNGIIESIKVDNPIFGCYFNQEVAGAGIVAILETGEYSPGSKFVSYIFNETRETLESGSRDIYLSYLEKQETGPDIRIIWQDSVWTFVSGNVAVLNFTNTSGVSRIAGFVAENGDPGEIDSDVPGTYFDPNTDYRVTKDITITSPISYYNAILEGVKKTDGSYPTVTFAYSEFDGDWAALIGKLDTNGHIKNLNFNITIAGVTADTVTYYADLVAHNFGEINNCVILNTSTLSVTKAPGQMYIGGFVSENKGHIANSNHLGTISIMTTSNKESYVGGIAAYSFEDASIANVANGTKSDSKTISVNNTFIGYVGGICGLSRSNISDAINYEPIAVKVNSSDEATAVGGVAGKVEGKNITITKSGNFANITSKNIGGVVGVTTGGVSNNDIIVAECMSHATLKGLRVGGVVYVGNCGLFQNCLSQNHIEGSTGEEDSSVLAGLVYKMNVSETGIVRAYNCVADCTFGNAGHKYYEDANQFVMGQGNIASILRGGYHPDPITAYGCIDVYALTNCYAINHGDASVVRTDGMTFRNDTWVESQASDAVINAKADHFIDLNDASAIEAMNTATTEELLVHRNGWWLFMFIETGREVKNLKVSVFDSNIWNISIGNIGLEAFKNA